VLTRTFDDSKSGVLGFRKSEMLADEAFATARKHGRVPLGCHDSGICGTNASGPGLRGLRKLGGRACRRLIQAGCSRRVLDLAPDVGKGHRDDESIHAVVRSRHRLSTRSSRIRVSSSFEPLH
jgi:hypothetical protein